MKKTIEEIVKKIPKNVVFDSHFIINELIKSDSDTYGRFFKSKTNSSHGRIGKIIKNYAIKQKDKSYSENIHNKGSRNTLWKKN
jgi:hypothetical protein